MSLPKVSSILLHLLAEAWTSAGVDRWEIYPEEKPLRANRSGFLPLNNIFQALGRNHS